VDSLSALEGWALKLAARGGRLNLRYLMVTAASQAQGCGMRLRYFERLPEAAGMRLGMGPLPLKQREKGSLALEGAVAEPAEVEGGFGFTVTPLQGGPWTFAVATDADRAAWIATVGEASRALRLQHHGAVAQPSRLLVDSDAGRVLVSGYLWVREQQAWTRRFLVVSHQHLLCVFASHLAYEERPHAYRGDDALAVLDVDGAVVAMIPNDVYELPLVLRVRSARGSLVLRAQTAREYQVWVRALMLAED
jgi:hypothetical protein